MKRNISDILDSYRDDTVELELSAPLSSRRIKELTMSRVKKTHKVRRLGLRLLAAAAIISLMTVTAFAAETIFNAGDIIRDLFRGEISDSQVEVMNELGGNFQPQTVTSEGTTVTLAAAYGDAYKLHLYFQVIAPEGTVLPDGIYYEFSDRNAIDYSAPEHWEDLKPGEDAPYDDISHSITIEPLADENPGDNRKDFHVVIDGQPGTECRFNDGYSKLFSMTGIYEQVPDVDGDTDGFVLLAPGEFTFDVGIVNAVKVVELDVEGLTYGGHKTRYWTHDSPCIESCEGELTGETDPETGLPVHFEEWDYSVTVESMSISPLSADWVVTYETSDETMSYGLDFVVVLKDGTVVKNISGLGGGDNGSKCFGNSYFTEPIDMSQIDYILIGDEEIGQTHRVYLPTAE